jgi:hypothetical protein
VEIMMAFRSLGCNKYELVKDFIDMATIATNLPLKLFHTSNFDAVSNGSQYGSDL